LILLVVLMQCFFSAGDILARKNMKKEGAYWDLIRRPWIVGFIILQCCAVGTFFYLLHSYNLSKVAVLSASMTMFLSVICGSLYLKEKIEFKQLIAVAIVFVVIVLQGLD